MPLSFDEILANVTSARPGNSPEENRQIAQNIFDNNAAKEARGEFGSTVIGEGNAQVAIPGFVDFDAGAILDQALEDAREQGGFNRDVFLDSFNNLANNLARETINTELEGLETFVPRASSLIREQDRDTNNEVLTQSDIFDNRNLTAAQGATNANTALRRDVFDSFAPGVRDSLISSLDRLEGDASRVRDREGISILTDSLREVAARSARSQGADFGAAGGFGIDSAATRSFIDRFDIDKRIALEEAELNRQRGGDTAIQNAETSIQNAASANTSLFDRVIAPGIQDFNAIQATPTVTDVGGQIRPTPTTDAGTLRRQFTNNLTDLQTISPTTVFNTSTDLQDRELTFEQDVLNTEADAQNQLFGLQQEQRREEIANDQFQQALALRKEQQQLAGNSQLISGGIKILTDLFTGSSGGGTGTSGGSTGTAGGTASILSKALDFITGQGGGDFTSGGVEGVSDIPGVKFLFEGVENVVAEGAAEGAGQAGLATVGKLAAVYLAIRGGAEVVEDVFDGEVTEADLDRLVSSVGTGPAINGLVDFLGLDKEKFADVARISNGIFSGGFSELIRAIPEAFGSGKNERQQQRDGLRSILQEIDVLDNDFKVTLADGSKFDLGVDGENKLENVGTNIDGKTERFTFDVDFSNPIAGTVVGYTNPLATILFGNPAGKEFTGHLTNAVMSTAPTSTEAARANAQVIALQAGKDYSTGISTLNQLQASGQLSPEIADAYKNGWYELWFGGAS